MCEPRCPTVPKTIHAHSTKHYDGTNDMLHHMVELGLTAPVQGGAERTPYLDGEYRMNTPVNGSKYEACNS